MTLQRLNGKSVHLARMLSFIIQSKLNLYHVQFIIVAAWCAAISEEKRMPCAGGIQKKRQQTPAMCEKKGCCFNYGETGPWCYKEKGELFN